MNKALRLEDIIDMEVWQKIQDTYAKATGFAAIIVDKDGNPMLEYSNFSDYCLEVRKTRSCEFCYRSDAVGGDAAARERRPVIYRCHAGLIDFAVPIVVEGEYMGAILSGQARLEEDEDCPEKVNPYYKSSGRLDALYQKTIVSSYERIKAASELLETLANHLVEMRMGKLVENRLHEKEIQLSEERRLRSEVEAALKEADLKALQSQLNPHFLFNVLNTIGRLALIENAEKTQEMIYEFSDLMRYTLRRSEAVTLGDELEYVKNYLSIQKTRLGERLNYTISIEDGTEQVRCPAMIVQPFVENAVNYVAEPRAQGGDITIRTAHDGGDVQIQIEDNGEGIGAVKAGQLLDGTYTGAGGSTGIGIGNANKRLKYYYGQQYQIRIGRSPSGGTAITLRVPNGKSVH